MYDTAGKGSFRRSIRPLLRRRTSLARCRSLSSGAASSEGCQVSPGVSMNTMVIPFSSSVTSRACGVVVGLLVLEEGVQTSRVGLRASEFINALFPDYSAGVEPKGEKERMHKSVRWRGLRPQRAEA